MSNAGNAKNAMSEYLPRSLNCGELGDGAVAAHGPLNTDSWREGFRGRRTEVSHVAIEHLDLAADLTEGGCGHGASGTAILANGFAGGGNGGGGLGSGGLGGCRDR